MLLTNLAEPEWIYVPCQKGLLHQVICKKNRKKQDHSVWIGKNLNSTCSEKHLSFRNHCHFFMWYDGAKHRSASFLQLCGEHDMASWHFQHISVFRALFDAVESIFPHFLSHDSQMKSQLLKHWYTRHLTLYKFRQSVIQSSDAKGFHICYKEKSCPPVQNLVFLCAGGGYVSKTYLCDGSIDCQNDDSDEQNCVCESSNHKSCRVMKTGNKTKCGPLHYQSHQGDCLQYVNQQIPLVNHTKSFFTCHNGMVIDETLKDDLFADCGPDAEDESKLLSLLMNGNDELCPHPDQLPCKEGHPKCYNVADICNFLLNAHGQLFPCSNGGHLQNCKRFECNQKFKCPSFYCIPWNMVCDGKWDCPAGDDESTLCMTFPHCLNMYRCKFTNHTCIHLGNICNGQKDCPLNDDEILCELKNVHCPSKCNCLLLAMICQNNNNFVQMNQSPFIFLSIHGVKNILFRFFQIQFPNVTFLNLTANFIFDICRTKLPRNLLALDMSFNSLRVIMQNCFQQQRELKYLLITSNDIVSVKYHSFNNLPSLLLLNLSNNPLFTFSVNLFPVTVSMKLLSLKNNSLKTIVDFNTFLDYKIDIVDTTDYHICCMLISNHKCHVAWKMLCANIMPHKKAKIYSIVASSTILILNIVSVTAHTKSRITNKAFSKIVLFINMNDMIYGTYVAMLWITDTEYEHVFLVKVEQWRSSWVCFTAFGMVIWFVIAAQIMLMFLSFSRLMIVVQPVDTPFKRPNFVLKTLFSLYAISLALSTKITLAVKFTEKILPSNLCSPFIDPTNSMQTIKIIIWFVSVSQVLTSLTIFSLHVLLVYHMYESQENIGKGRPKEFSKKIVVMNLAISFASNILSWFPASGMHIYLLFSMNYQTELIIWATLFALPFTCVVNPCVFVIGLVRKHIKSRQKIDRNNKIRHL